MHDDHRWAWMSFAELSATDVYELLQLRCAIFVVEQTCPYLDPDGLDFDAYHCLYREGGELLAYQRSLAPGMSYPEASALGRIVVAEKARGRGLSRELVRSGIAFNRRTWPGQAVEMSAQAHLQGLYESLGFEVCSEPYLEDDIPHVHMRLAAP